MGNIVLEIRGAMNPAKSMNNPDSRFAKTNTPTFPIASMHIQLGLVDSRSHPYKRLDVVPEFLPVTGSPDEIPDKYRTREILDEPSILHHLHSQLLHLYPYPHKETMISHVHRALKNRPWRFLYVVEIPEPEVRVVQKPLPAPTGTSGKKYDPHIDVSHIFPVFSNETIQLLAMSYSASYIKRMTSRTFFHFDIPS